MRVLSIDFDIIMAPSIELYNNLINRSTIDEVANDIELLKLANADYLHYLRITQYLLKIVDKISVNNIHFIRDHEEILQFIPGGSIPIELINIDHHHDWCYHPHEFNNPIEEGLQNCGNWVKYLNDNNYNLSSYTWVRNENSRFPEEKVDKIADMIFKDFALEEMPLPDIVVICLSPPWVPKVYHNLFYVWMEIFNKYHNKHYEIETIRREQR